MSFEPASNQALTPGTIIEKPIAAPKNGRSATVLVVEDDRVAQKLLGKVCANAGHTAIVVDNLANARDELYRCVLVDIVFLDSQLGRDWGWQLLAELRADALYKQLPVVVYTGHTERETLLQYIELGVQGVRAKPFKGEVILGEIDKALQTNWAGQMMHSPQAVCERLRIRESDYYTALGTAAIELDKAAREVRTVVGSRNSPRLAECLRQMTAKGNMIGMPAVEIVVNAVMKQVEEGDLARAISNLQHIDQFVTLIQQRAFTYMGVGGSPLPTRPMGERPPAPRTPLFSPATPKHTSAAFGRNLASAPAWVMGKYFSRLQSMSVFTQADIDEMVASALNRQPFTTFFAVLERLELLPASSVDQAVKNVCDISGFEMTFGKIAEQMGTKFPACGGSEAVRRVCEAIGVEKVNMIAESARIAQACQLDSPLNLSLLLGHSLTVGMVSFELGRLLKLANAHLLFGAGAAHDIGRWCLAITEPGFYSISVGLAQTDNTDMLMAERIMFGMNHEEIGRLLLNKAGIRELYQDVAGSHSKPESAPMQNAHRVTAAAVQIANNLAHAAGSDDKKHGDEARAQLSNEGHALWQMLIEAGVQFPMGPADLIHTLTPVTAAYHWIAAVLTSWASSQKHNLPVS